MKHDFVPGLCAHVDTDGFRLEEFEGQEDGDYLGQGNTTRYVEAVPGSIFCVGLTFGPDFLYARDDIECLMYLDGKRASGKLHTSNHPTRGVEFRDRSETTPTGTYRRKFQFSDLNTHDGGVSSELKEKLTELGTIKIKLVRCVKTSSTPAKTRASFEQFGGRSIPEKGLKGRAISTQATLGAPEKVRARMIYNVDYPYGKQPFAQFTFRYRSHKDLQVEGILPRSPSPAPLEERDPATLNADELRQLLEQRNQELKQLSQIKTEKRGREATIIDDDNDDDDEVTVTERSTKRQRTFQASRDSGVELIDLTED